MFAYARSAFPLHQGRSTSEPFSQYQISFTGLQSVLALPTTTVGTDSGVGLVKPPAQLLQSQDVLKSSTNQNSPQVPSLPATSFWDSRSPSYLFDLEYIAAPVPLMTGSLLPRQTAVLNHPRATRALKRALDFGLDTTNDRISTPSTRKQTSATPGPLGFPRTSQPFQALLADNSGRSTKLNTQPGLVHMDLEDLMSQPDPLGVDLSPKADASRFRATQNVSNVLKAPTGITTGTSSVTKANATSSLNISPTAASKPTPSAMPLSVPIISTNEQSDKTNDRRLAMTRASANMDAPSATPTPPGHRTISRVDIGFMAIALLVLVGCTTYLVLRQRTKRQKSKLSWQVNEKSGIDFGDDEIGKSGIRSKKESDVRYMTESELDGQSYSKPRISMPDPTLLKSRPTIQRRIMRRLAGISSVTSSSGYGADNTKPGQLKTTLGAGPIEGFIRRWIRDDAEAKLNGSPTTSPIDQKSLSQEFSSHIGSMRTYEYPLDDLMGSHDWGSESQYWKK